MGRIVGRYLDTDIRIDSLYLRNTYTGFTAGRTKAVNAEIVNSKIDIQTADLFGAHLPYHIVDREALDYSAELPPETVYAHLECARPIAGGHGSHLVLVWFQGYDDDPFAVAKGHLRRIDWEKHAADFQL